MAYEPSILIVEDDASVRKYFEMVLSEDGYSITSVATGRHGLLLARHTAFDLAIVDMSLPDLDGPNVIREIIAEFPDITAIAASGAMEERMRSLARIAGAASVFQKPITPRKLRKVVYAALDPSYSWRGTA